MPTKAIVSNYRGEVRDRRENFGGNILVFVGWDKHLLFCSALAFALPPDMPFQDFRQNVLKQGFSQHPDFDSIKWDDVEWQLNGRALAHDDSKTLEQLGFDHKSLLRFNTPGLNGWNGSGV